MEDSAKRKERLQAMRTEASSASTERPSPSFSVTNTPLSNPLVNPSPSSESSLSPHRFDYYTDPAAAYCAAKRKTNSRGGDTGLGRYSHPLNSSSPIYSTSPVTCAAAQPIGQQMDYHMPPSYTSYPHQLPSPNQSFYDASFSRPQTGLLRSPLQYPSPASGDREAYSHQAPSPNQSSCHTPFLRPQTGSLRSPIQFLSPPGSGDRRVNHNLPRPWNMSGNFSSERSLTPNSSNGGASGFRYGEGRSNSSYSGMRGSPHSHSSGRGGRFRGRGGGANGFFVKSMVKDPWRKLKPIVGNILIPLSDSRPWLPKSIVPKKPKVDEVSSIDIKPKQNLAEFLAFAFEEAVSNEQEGEASSLPKPNGGI